MDLHHPVSIYKPDLGRYLLSIPDEGLENLHGWKLQVAVPYNHHREYLLTAENSVVVDSKVEGISRWLCVDSKPRRDAIPDERDGICEVACAGL